MRIEMLWFGGARSVGSDSARLAQSMRDTLATMLRGVANDCRDAKCVRDLRPRAYYTGAALAALLAERNPSWQRAVENGAYLDSLLRE